MLFEIWVWTDWCSFNILWRWSKTNQITVCSGKICISLHIHLANCTIPSNIWHIYSYVYGNKVQKRPKLYIQMSCFLRCLKSCYVEIWVFVRLFKGGTLFCFYSKKPSSSSSVYAHCLRYLYRAYNMIILVLLKKTFYMLCSLILLPYDECFRIAERHNLWINKTYENFVLIEYCVRINNFQPNIVGFVYLKIRESVNFTETKPTWNGGRLKGDKRKGEKSLGPFFIKFQISLNLGPRDTIGSLTRHCFLSQNSFSEYKF